MYYPIQIPYILHEEFSNSICYSEMPVANLSDFVICVWEMQPHTEEAKVVENIIVADGCIDLVVAYDQREIGFSGMSQTDFHFTINLPSRYFGARLCPGAFYQLTGREAKMAMDNFLPLALVDETFHQNAFFSLSFEAAKEHFINYLQHLCEGLTANSFTRFFHDYKEHPPATAAALYEQLHFSPRQCQRLFDKNYGITPKMALSILRFQKCLEILISGNTRPSDILTVTQYYDQPHFIKDFKKNIGLTPLELVNRYRN